jgi:hypothetical protein
LFQSHDGWFLAGQPSQCPFARIVSRLSGELHLRFRGACTMTDLTEARTAQRWRQRFGLADAAPAGVLESPQLESTAESTAAGIGGTGEAPADRIERAREAMFRLVADRLGGDPALLDQVRALALSGQDAVAILAADEAAVPPPGSARAGC